MRSGKHPGRRPSRAWENGGSLVAVTSPPGGTREAHRRDLGLRQHGHRSARGLSVLGGLGRQRRWRSRRILGPRHAEQLGELARQGHDVSEQKAGANGTTVDLVLSPSQRDDLVKKGINPQLKKVNGQDRSSSSPRSRRRAATRCGGPTTSRAASATRCMPSRPTTPSIAKLVKLGTTSRAGRSSRSSSPRAPAARRTVAVPRSSTAPPSTRASGSRPRSTGGS